MVNLLLSRNGRPTNLPPRETLRTLQGSDAFGIVFESASIGLKLIDLQTFRLVDANPALQKLLGYSLDELCGRPYVDFTHPGDRADEHAAHTAVLDGSADSYTIVKRYVRKDGSLVRARVTATVVRGDDGAPRYGLAMVQDVTREHDAEQARCDAEARHRLIVETAMDGIWLVDAEYRTTLVNEAMASMLGHTPEEMIGRPLFDFVDEPEEALGDRHPARRRAGIDERFEVRLRRADGTALVATLSANSVFDERGAYAGALAVVRDDTELRRSQDAVAQRVRQLETIAELGREILDGATLGSVLGGVGPAVAGALEVDTVTVLALQPDGGLRMVAGHGWPDSVLGETVIPAETSQAGYQLAAGEKRLIVEDLLLEERFTPPEKLLERGIRGGLSCRIDGDERAFGVLAVHTRAPRRFSDDDANFVDSIANLIGSVVRRDAAEMRRRRAEADRAATAERFRMLAENAQDIVFRFRLGDEPGYDYVSPAVATITGIAPEQLYADPRVVIDRLHPDDRQHVLASREQPQQGPIVVRFRRDDGVEVVLERRATYRYDDAGRLLCIEGIVRDVTERVAEEERRRSLEEQLRQSQRLEAIGQLAGGIAHDFNNLLLGIRGFAELALRRLEGGEDGVDADVRGVIDATDRASQLTGQLLAFGRRQVLRPEVLDLCEVVREMARLLHRLIGEHVELETVCADDPVLVEADRSQIEQVIANLAVNARDAMPGGGRLRIETTIAGGREHALLVVSDNGSGMDAEIAARAFDPFFTTKGENGNGLGLATVHGIVSQSGGRIALETSPGAGTTFSIALPLADGTVAPAAPVAAEVTGGRERVLVIEDDPTVRAIVAAMLEDRGYAVAVADGGEHAADVARELGDQLYLVVSDLVMPGLGGRETLQRIREHVPGVKVLFMSGYTDDVVIRDGGLDAGMDFIQKPFDGDDLARRVRELLDKHLG